MPVELKGQQIRIRVFNPRLCKRGTFRTHDVGRKGRLHRIACIRKNINLWDTQSWRLNLSHYRGISDIERDLVNLAERNDITMKDFMKAKNLAWEWIMKK